MRARMGAGLPVRSHMRSAPPSAASSSRSLANSSARPAESSGAAYQVAKGAGAPAASAEADCTTPLCTSSEVTEIPRATSPAMDEMDKMLDLAADAQVDDSATALA